MPSRDHRYVWLVYHDHVYVGRRIGPEEDARMEAGLPPWEDAGIQSEDSSHHSPKWALANPLPGEVIHYYPDCKPDQRDQGLALSRSLSDSNCEDCLRARWECLGAERRELDINKAEVAHITEFFGGPPN